MAFATLAEFKTQLNFPASDTSKDTELQLYLDAADKRTAQIVGQSSSASHTERVFSSCNRLRTSYRPVTALTSVTAVESALAVNLADLVIEHDLGIVRRINGWYFDGWYDLVYTAGYSSIQPNHKLANLIIAQHLWQLQNGRGRPTSGEDIGIGLGFAIPNRAMELLQDDPAVVTSFG